MRAAVCTMSYNENINLPLWVNYYGKLFGFENLFVFDHGSDDGSTENLDHINLIRLPRTPYSDRTRASLISDFCKCLLNFYDYFVFTDTDEILCCDPEYSENLRTYLEDRKPEYVTAIGLNLFHCDEEPRIDVSAPILAQRHYAYFLPAMCKTLITARPIQWGGGFHACTVPQRFDSVFNFHLKQMDRGYALYRLRVLRDVDRDRPFAKHQLIADEDLENKLARTNSKPRTNSFEFKKEIEEFLGQVKENRAGMHAFVADGQRRPPTPLKMIPDRFKDIF